MLYPRKKHFALALLALMLFTILTPLAQAAEGPAFKDWEDVAAHMCEILDKALEAYSNGNDATAGVKGINDAYFGVYETTGFEKIVLAHISGKRVSTVEHQFYLAKKSMKNGAPIEEVKGEIETLKTMLNEDAKELDSMRSSDDQADPKAQAWATFGAVVTLTLREGLEAILVVAAIAAYLKKTNNTSYLRGVYVGAILGVVFSIVLAFIFNQIARTAGAAQSGISQEMFEGFAMFLAVIVLFYVSNWMLSKSEVEVWNQYIQTKVEDSISKGNYYTLAFTAFLAVAREGAELILFFQGLRENIANNPTYMWAGIAVSAVVLVILYLAITKLSVRLPLKPFFTFTSILMFIMCISFMGKGVFELQEAGLIERTEITWMNGFNIELLGFYDRYETLIPQIVLLLITLVTIYLQMKANKRKRAELQAKAE